MRQPYERVETSLDVYSAILENHKGSENYIILFSSSETAQCADMESSVVWARRISWGFPDAIVPLIETDIICHRADENTSRATHTYYLCYPIEDSNS